MASIEEILRDVSAGVGGNLLPILKGLGILVGGWLIAALASSIVRGVLRRISLDNRLESAIAGGNGPRIDLSRWMSKVVFYLIMLFVLVAFFQVVRLTAVTSPLVALLDQVFEYLPRVVGAALLLLIAWIIASFVKMAIQRAARTLRLDERLGERMALPQERRVAVGDSVGVAAFWLVFLVFLPGVLGTLQMQGLLAPVQEMFSPVLGVFPNMIAASLIVVVGWGIARIVRGIAANLLSVIGADQLGEKAGLGKTSTPQSLSHLVGTIVYILILVPSIIAALNTLEIEAIARPATAMLTTFLNAIPSVFAAMLLIGLSLFVARLVGGFVTNLLTGIGFNTWPSRLGLRSAPFEGKTAPADVAGRVAVVAIMLFASIEAAGLLQFDALGALLTEFTAFGGQVILALLVFGIGLYLANLARRVILSTGGSGATLGANAARIAIIVLVSAMALRQMGIAGEIVNLAFGIVVGSLALAAALAIGLGGREVAGRAIEKRFGGGSN